MHYLRWFLKLFILLSLLDKFSQPLACSPVDRAALISFKSKITEDTTETLASWVGANCCEGDWEGVECSPSTMRVTSLILQNPNSDTNPQLYMKGTISPSLGDLQFLQVLIISGMKHISGGIPISLTNLNELSQLILDENALTGVVPMGLTHMHSLKTLSLSGNRLQGLIPPSLGNLSNLVQLNLARNHLVSTIPKSIKALHSIQFIDLSYNSLSGSIPDSIGRLQNLTYLDLSFNKLSGSIPVPLCRLRALSDLFLNNNKLKGSIPGEIDNLKSLSALSFGANQLNGTIPESLGNLRDLWYLNLSRNSLTNPLPSALAKGIPSNSSIDLSYNNLDLGTIPRWILTRELTAVHLAGCKLMGKLPKFTNPISLTSLDLSHNHYSDDIHAFLTRMPNLETINLSSNKLKVDISEIIGNKTSSFLETIDVSRNLISGSIPEFRAGLNLKVLNIHSNKIEGRIPSSISNLAELQHLDISKNHVTGVIPTSLGLLSKLQWLDVSNNSLTGEIPSSLIRIKGLQHANFQANMLCGQIPQGRPFNVLPVVAYAHNNCLCGKPLPPCKGKKQHINTNP